MEQIEDLALNSQDLKQFQLARELLGRFHVMMRLAKTHDRYNSAVADAAEALYVITNELIDEAQVVRFDVADGCVFFNRTRLRASLSGFNTLKYFADEMAARGVSSLSFDEIAEVDDFLSFSMVFARLDLAHDDPFTELERLITLEGIAGIEVRPMRGLGEGSGDVGSFSGPTRDEAKRSFFSAVHIVRQAVRDGISRGKVNPRKVKRVVESVVDSIVSDEESMLALTAIKDYDEYTYYHSFNVCVYSIALGNRLGLPRQALCDVGIAALFHDVGKTDVPRNILNKIDNLTEKDWKVIQSHTLSGVKMLTYLKKLDRTILRSMIVAFCHHLNVDRTGYPETTRPIKPDAFSRIVRIADIYDALTSARSYRMRPFSAARALEIIVGKAGEELDPTLCAIFADVIGMAPEDPDDEVDGTGAEYSSVRSNPE
jgi:HD-GYP domain-containing protein (c-di-GMP phosphodiesterase class II)